MWSACAAIPLFHAASTAKAQSTYHPSSVRVEIGAWNYVPIFEFNAAGSSVSSILAVAQEGSTLGDNLVAVWYVREGNAWLKKSWTEKDRWGIVEEIKSSLSIPDDDDYRWGVGKPDVYTTATSAQPMTTYVLSNDPLAPVLDVIPDPEPLADLLVGSGYEAAKTPTDYSSVGCTPESMLDSLSMSVAVEGAKEEGDTKVVAEAIIATGLKACVEVATVIVPIRDRPVAPVTPWMPGTPGFMPGPLSCTFIPYYPFTRTQTFFRQRTKTCVTAAGVYIFCDQFAFIYCTEHFACFGVPVPGTVYPDGSCIPPFPVPAYTPPPGAPPCVPPATGPNMKLPPSSPSTGLPPNCTAPSGRTPTNCPCP